MSPKAKPGKSSPKKERSGGAHASGHEAVRVRWERKNIALFGGGLGAVILGYILLSQGSVSLAPVLLVAGYCVLIPLAFIL